MQEQSEIQGLYDQRIKQLNKLRTGMADIVLRFSPIAQKVKVILMTKDIDIYGDTENKVEAEFEKLAVVSKNPDMAYVQDLFNQLVEEDEKLPWLVKMTITGLPRLVNHDDRIEIAGMTYSVSKVAPVNRLNDGLMKILVYPERNLQDDGTSDADSRGDNPIWDSSDDIVSVFGADSSDDDSHI